MSTGAVIARIITQYSDKGSKAAQKDIAKTAKKIDDFNKRVVKAYAAGAAAAAFFAYKVGKFAVKSAVEDAKSQEALALVLKNTTNATNTQIAAVEKYIEKQQLLTNISDTDLRKSLTTLVAVTKDLSSAQLLNNLAMDIAAARSLDLSTVANALARATQGNLTPLKKLNLGIDANTLAANDFAGAYKQLEKTYGGAAERIAKKDPFTKLKLQFEEIAEDIGTALLPALTLLAAKIQTDIVPQIQDWVEANKTLITQSLVDLVKTIENIAYAGVQIITFLSKFEELLAVIALLAPFGFIASQLMLVFKFTKGVVGITSKVIDKFILFGKETKTALNIVKGAGAAKGFLGFFKNLFNVITLIIPQARLLKIAIAAVGTILTGGVFKFFLDKNNEKNIKKTTTAIEEQGRTALRATKTTRLTAEQLKKKNKEEADAAALIAKTAAEQKKALELQKKSAKFEADYQKINERIAKTHGVKLLSSEEEKLVQINAAEALLDRQKKIDEINKQKLKDLKEEVLLQKVRNELSERYEDILKALSDNEISSKDIATLAAKWGVSTKAAEAYIETLFAIQDGTISDSEIVKLAQTWGLTQAQAAKYLDFYQALNDGILSDAEIAKLASKWYGDISDPKTAYGAVKKYADFVAVVSDNKLDDSEITKLMSKWGLTKDEVVAYIKQVGIPVVPTGTLLDTTQVQALRDMWKSTYDYLKMYYDLLAQGKGVIIPKTAPGGFIPGSGDDPAVGAAAAAAAAEAAAAAADAAAVLAESEQALIDSGYFQSVAGQIETLTALRAETTSGTGINFLLKEHIDALKDASSTFSNIPEVDEQDKLRAMGLFTPASTPSFDVGSFRKAEEASMTAMGAVSRGEYVEGFRAAFQSPTMNTSKGFSNGDFLRAPTQVYVTVEGNVSTEQDLVQAVRNGLLATQYNGNQLLLEAI